MLGVLVGALSVLGFHGGTGYFFKSMCCGLSDDFAGDEGGNLFHAGYVFIGLVQIKLEGYDFRFASLLCEITNFGLAEFKD